MVQHSKKKKWLLRLVMLEMSAMMLLSFALIPPVSASNPSVPNTQNSTFATQVGNPAVTASGIGDLLVLGTTANYQNQTDILNNIVLGVNSVTDSCGNTWIQANGAQNLVFVGIASPIQQVSSAVTVWYTTTACSGLITLTVTMSQAPNGGSNWIEELADVTNLSNPAIVIATLNAKNLNSPYTTSTPNTFSGATFSFGQIGGVNVGTITQGASFTLLGTQGQYSVSVASPTSYPFSANKPASSMVLEAGVTFTISGAVTTTSIINTLALGDCTKGSNGTANYLTTNFLYYYQSQGVGGSFGTIDNVTLKVSAVHINANTGQLLILTYTTLNPNPPGGGNPWQLLSGNTQTLTVTNGTTNFFIHNNPQSVIGSTNWYMVAVMALTTKSNSATVTGSGISVYETSQVGVIEYQFNAGSSTPPASFYAATTKTSHHEDFMCIHQTYPVSVITTTLSTFTTTLQGSVTATVLSTSVITSLNSAAAIQYTTNDMIILLVILGPAMLLTVALGVTTRSPFAAGIGFIAGLMLGTGIGLQAQLVPPAFLAISVIVGLFITVGLYRSSGGGGP